MFMYPSTDCSSPIHNNIPQESDHGSYSFEIGSEPICLIAPKLTLVDNARVELDDDRVADDVAEEAGRVLALSL